VPTAAIDGVSTERSGAPGGSMFRPAPMSCQVPEKNSWTRISLRVPLFSTATVHS
jgi:hypothetical protein